MCDVRFSIAMCVCGGVGGGMRRGVDGCLCWRKNVSLLSLCDANSFSTHINDFVNFLALLIFRLDDICHERNEIEILFDLKFDLF